MAYDRDLHRAASPERAARMRAWAQRKPCVALMGEFSAGKSTLLNFLIEEDVIPTRATATEVPPVWFSHGEGGCYWVDAEERQHPIAPADVANVPMTARYIRVFSPAEILEHCDVVDTPGISDPNLAVESWRFAAGIANMVLWCSSATQAWRETERSAWLSLPERLRNHSLLIVTRADKLVGDGDREKVDRRLARETAGLFRGRVFMATLDAVKAKSELSDGENSPLWESSGAADLLDRLAERFEAIYEERAELLQRHLSGAPRPVAATTMPEPAEFAEAGAPAQAETETAALDSKGAEAEPTGAEEAGAEAAGAEAAGAEATGADATAAEVTMPRRPVRVQIDTSRRIERLRPEDADAMKAALRSDDEAEAETTRPEADAPDQAAELAGADDDSRVHDDDIPTLDALGHDDLSPEPEAEVSSPDSEIETAPEIGSEVESAAAEPETDDADVAPAAKPEAADLAEGPIDSATPTPDEAPATGPFVLDAEHKISGGDIPPPKADGAPVPPTVALWREIVARTDLAPGNAQIAAMIEEFLLALDGAGEATGAEPGDSAPEADAAEDAPAEKTSWRRLA